MPSQNTTTTESGNFELSETAGTLCIHYVPSPLLTIGYHRRAVHAIRLVKSAFKKLSNCECIVQHGSLTAYVTNTNSHDIKKAIRSADLRLRQFGEEKLTAKRVETILDMTAVERQRWTKDGRLQSFGAEYFNNGRGQIRVFTYSLEAIAAVVAKPELISTWREIDREGPIDDLGTPDSLVRRKHRNSRDFCAK